MKTNSQVLMGVVLVILVVLAIGGGWIYFTSQTTSPTVSTAMEEDVFAVATEPAPSEQKVTALADPTASWKTFVNTRDGYSVKYPEDETVPNPDYPSELVAYGFETSLVMLSYGGWGDAYLFNGSADEAIAASKKIDPELRVNYTYTDVIIGGKPATLVKWSNNLDSQSRESRTYFVEYKPGKTLYISGPDAFIRSFTFLQ